jgi:hypothetical protein
MYNRPYKLAKTPTLLFGATALLLVGTPARAQSTSNPTTATTPTATTTPTTTTPAPTTTSTSQNGQNNNTSAAQSQNFQGNENTRRELSQFDQFLDEHREISEQVRRDPALLDNRNFVDTHPALQTFLQDHPGIRSDVRQNAYAFMHQEERFDIREDARDRDAMRRDAEDFDRFMNSHRETAEQLRKDPSLMERREFVDSHTDLRTYLQSHQGTQDEIRQDPNFFMHPEQRVDNPQNGQLANDRNSGRNPDRDSTEFRQFLDSHREIAEQLRSNPGRINNDAFVRDHSELQAYLQTHPGVRQEIAANSNDFMRADNNFRSDNSRFDRDPSHQHMANFGAFMSGHADIARDVSSRPDVVKDQKYVDNHPEFKTYLNANPEVRSELMANPQSFVKGSQQYTNGSGSASGSGSGTPSSNGTTGGKTSTGNSSNGSSGGPAAASPGASGYTPGHDSKVKQ